MRRKSRYDLNIPWDDPYDRKENRRGNERCIERFKIKIGVQVESHKTLLVGQAIVENISQGGVLCKTKQRLTEGQEVHLSIPTRDYSEGKDFPLKYIGTATVSRAQVIEGDVVEAGLIFGPNLSEDMSFALFIETMHSVSEIKASL
ncbi:MAG: PilZ domain-containing protein [Candidatus Hydrogenedentota bacterium]